MSGPNEPASLVYLARHGETAWALTGQHTGRVDLPLTDHGEREAGYLGERLKGLTFARVFTSPLQRARRTCELAGFGAVAEIDPDLDEWDYGEYEGLTPTEIRAERPDWSLFRDGCPGGESPQQVAARADRVVARLRSERENGLLFSSRHFLQALTLRWLGVEALTFAQHFMLSTSSLSALGYREHPSAPIIQLWNETHYLPTPGARVARPNQRVSTEGRA